MSGDKAKSLGKVTWQLNALQSKSSLTAFHGNKKNYYGAALTIVKN